MKIILAFFSVSVCANFARAESLDMSKVIGPRWAMETIKTKHKDKESGLAYEVNYDTFYVFDKDKMTEEVVCHFRQPTQKTIIVSTSVATKVSGDMLSIIDGNAQKQELKLELAPKSGKGARKVLTMYCEANLQPADYKLTLKGDGLTMEALIKPVVLHKYVAQ